MFALIDRYKISQDELKAHVRSTHGSISVPDKIFFVEDLPKTRSGKIVRRLLKSIFLDQPIGDISTLINPEVIEQVVFCLQ